METDISYSDFALKYHDDILKMSETQFAAFLNRICFESLEIRENPELVLPVIEIWLSVNPGKTNVIASVMATIEEFSSEEQIFLQEIIDSDKQTVKEGFANIKLSVSIILLFITTLMLCFYCYKYFFMNENHYKNKFFIVLSVCPLTLYIFHKSFKFLKT